MMQNPQHQYGTLPEPVVMSVQPPTVIPQSHVSDTCKNYRSTQAILLGAFQIFFGSFYIILSIVGIVLGAYMTSLAHGIWCGVFFVVTGSFGVHAANTKSRCVIVTFMVFAVLSAVLALIVVIIGAVGWSVGSMTSNRYYYPHMSSNCQHMACLKRTLIINVLFVFVGLGEAILAIWSSAICYAGARCDRQGEQGQVIQPNIPLVQYAQPGTQSQVVYLTSPQAGVAYVQQPGPVQQVDMPPSGYIMQPQQPTLQPVQQQNTGVKISPPYSPDAATSPTAEEKQPR